MLHSRQDLPELEIMDMDRSELPAARINPYSYGAQQTEFTTRHTNKLVTSHQKTHTYGLIVTVYSRTLGEQQKSSTSEGETIKGLSGV